MKFVDGVFIKLYSGVTNSETPYSILRFNIKKDEFLESIEKFKPDDEGWVHFVVKPRKDDSSRFYMALDDWKPKAKRSSARGKTANKNSGDTVKSKYSNPSFDLHTSKYATNKAKSGSKPAEPTKYDPADDLPF